MVKVILTHKQNQCNSYECFQFKDFLLHILTVDEKRELHVELWVKRSKVGGFLGALIFRQDILTHLGQCFLLPCTQIHDDARKTPIKFEEKLSFIKVGKGRCPNALDYSAGFSVLCQVGRFMYAFWYQFRLIFRCFGIFPIDRTVFLHLHNTRK